MSETPESGAPRPPHRRHGRNLVLLAGAAAVVAGLAWAGSSLAQGWHGGGFGPMGRGPGMMGMMMLDQLDADGDGKVSRAEVDAFRKARFESADKSRDGRLDQAEFETLWLEVTRPMRIRAFQMLDADGDGIVTAVEVERPVNRMFGRLDRDGDGVLEPTDRPMREHHGDRRGPPRDRN
jgi:hypothetical protein